LILKKVELLMGLCYRKVETRFEVSLDKQKYSQSSVNQQGVRKGEEGGENGDTE